MLIDFLIDILFGLIDFITSGLNIPAFPDEAISVINDVVQYLQLGLAILGNYTHLDYLLTLFGVIVAIDVAILSYKFIMWVLRKIPMLGIS